MALAIFDLDNTLLRGDSDYLWGMYLIDKGAVDEESHQRENERFYQEYIKRPDGYHGLSALSTGSSRPYSYV